MKTSRWMAASAFAAALVLGSCGGASNDSPQAGSERSNDHRSVATANIAFAPSELEVSVGDTVVWTSEDEGVRHTVTSGVPAKPGIPGSTGGKDARPDGIFRGELNDVGASFAFTFSEAGAFAYFCEIHPAMVARVVVN